MRWLKALLGLAVVGGFLYFVLAVAKKGDGAGALSPPTRTVEAAVGTEVPLILLTPLDSGGSAVGQKAQFVVSEDVVKDGVVVIPQGSLATAKVVKSRSGTLAGTLTNTPARLEAELDSVGTVDGRAAKLKAGPDSNVLTFDAANTRMEEKANVIDAVTDPQARDTVVQTALNLAQGKKFSDEEALKSDAQWRALAEKYGMKETQAFMDAQREEKGGHKDLSSVVSAIQKGDLGGLSGLDIVLGAKAAGEIIDLGSGIDKSLRGIFKGSNIHARTGLRVKAYLAEPVKARSTSKKA